MILKKKILKDFITPASGLSSKDEILKFIAKEVKKSSYLKNVTEEELYKSLLEREQLCSTGLGDGIAIPHCALEEAEDFVVGFISLVNPVAFDSLDGKPVKLVFYIAGPKSRRKTHINLLSAISKLMKDGNGKKKLETAETVEQVLEIFSGDDDEQETELIPKPKSLFQVIIQKESLFTDVLEILTSGEDNDVTVLESNNASGYLHQLPLFSTYWTDEGAKFNRIILSVVDRHTCNDLIRRIKMIDDYDPEKPGMLITVQEAIYSEGSLDY